MNPPTPDSPPAFHGWKILGLATSCQFVAVGFTLYLVGLYIEPLSAATGATPGQLGWASSILLAVSSLLGPPLGYLVDRGRVRAVMLAGAVALAAGLVLLSLVANLAQAALVCVFLIAPGAAMLNMITAGALLVQWFERRRGLAMGIAAAGISAGGFAMPPLAAWLMATVDWRATTLLLGLVVGFALVPAIWFLAIRTPAELGQFPDGDREPRSEAGGGRSQPRQRLAQLLARRDFWLICLAVGAVNFASVMVITYLVPFARENGVDLQASALMLSVYSGAAFAGKFVAGWLSDRFPPRRLLTVIALVMALGLVAMFNAAQPLLLACAIAVVGVALGGMMPVWASLIAVNFGPQAYGRVLGAMSLVMTVAGVVPGPLGGYLYDISGSYALALEILVWVLLAGAAVSVFIPAGMRSQVDDQHVC